MTRLSTVHEGVQLGGRHTIGGYGLPSELGRGAQGRVYLAEDTTLARRVALEVLDGGDQLMHAGLATRFRREAEAAARLEQPASCAAHGFGNDGDLADIAMRHVEPPGPAPGPRRVREGLPHRSARFPPHRPGGRRSVLCDRAVSSSRHGRPAAPPIDPLEGATPMSTQRITCLLAAVALASASALAGNQTLQVPGDHASIQAAVDAAGAGDTIHVGPGHWLESVSVTKPGLTLVGQGALVDPEYDGHGFVVLAPDVTIRSFTIVNAVTGVYAESHGTYGVFGGLVVEGNTIVSPQEYGISGNVVSAVVRGNSVENAGFGGIGLDGWYDHFDSGFGGGEVEAQLVVDRNRVRLAHGLGIALWNASSALVRRNVVEQCSGSGLSVDVESGYAGSAVVRVIGNRSTDNGNTEADEEYDQSNDLACGIEIRADGYASEDIELEVCGNRCSGNTFGGIRVLGRFGWMDVVDNLCRGNQLGFEFDNASDFDGTFSGDGSGSEASLWIAGNQAEDNSSDGIVVRSDGDDLVLSGNTATGNGGHGFHLYGYGIVVSGNRARSNYRNGILIDSGDSTVITGNVVKSNGHQGISNDGQDTVITDNTCEDNANGMGPDIAGAGQGDGTVDEYAGNTGLGGPDTENRL